MDVTFKLAKVSPKRGKVSHVDENGMITVFVGEKSFVISFDRIDYCHADDVIDATWWAEMISKHGWKASTENRQYHCLMRGGEYRGDNGSDVAEYYCDKNHAHIDLAQPGYDPVCCHCGTRHTTYGTCP